MVSIRENWSRIVKYYRWSWQEYSGIIVAIIITGFIFSFRDWGADSFDALIGLKNLLTVFLVAALTFFIRYTFQKIYALSQGYRIEFKVWWAGIILALIISFLSFGYVPLILIGGIASALMIKQRLGEFRYGYSYSQNAAISMWGIGANLILAILCAIGLYAAPENYFLYKGLILNLIMAVCTLIPFPRLEGLNIFFGSRGAYYVSIAAVILAGILLLLQTSWGLILAIVVAALSLIVYFLISSEK